MEHWKDIPGYEGIYEASDQGRIRTCEGKTTSNSRFPIRVWKQRVLKFKKAKRKGSGLWDYRVSLWRDGKCKDWLVARLIALTWCDGYVDGATVNHIDGNPQNNCAFNLEWVSHADNIRLGFEAGLYSTQHACVLKNKESIELRFHS